MLKISRIKMNDTAVTLQLEGRVSGPWVEELRRLCVEALHDGSRLILDLTGVSFVDGEGIVFLQGLPRQRVTLTNCSPFVTELLKGVG